MRPTLSEAIVGACCLTLSACDTKFASGDGDGGAPADAGDAGTGGNEAPVAVDDTATTQTGEAVDIRVIENDTDADEGDTLTVSEVGEPENGNVEILAARTRVVYTSAAGFVGTDTFDYTVVDEQGETDQGTVTVDVEALPVLTLMLTSPEEAAVVEGPDVVISFEVTGCDVARPDSDPEGCHVHKFLDGDRYTDTDGQGFGHYTPADFTISPVADGEHEFRLELISNDGSDDPVVPYVSDSVTFVVTLPAK